MDFFRLADKSLPSLQEEWRRSDANFNKAVNAAPGIRVIRQDPVECLFSFICSSNNNIARISGMVARMCERFGEEVEVSGVAVEDRNERAKFYDFPTVDRLAQQDVADILTQLGFGYRAKFVAETAKLIANERGGQQWLFSLRLYPYDVARQQLFQLPGVGWKVADCVCLIGLDKAEAVPVDVHVWKITVEKYMPALKTVKHLSQSVYSSIMFLGAFYRDKFGPYAGWAHAVLFTADLSEPLRAREKRKPVMDKAPLSLVTKNVAKKTKTHHYA
ncbi:unnamed protein product [Soboliphyme baturini]|uniref:N-glycosylase/DNA lyase n=1 Tax=Soboliphyme baturini TaxID=241478 RepID=A0A183IJC1_9BILA|nr:unnamed protein product [Soboliphyme baturini]